MDTSRIVVVGSHIPALFLRVRRIPVPGETVIGWDYQEPMDGGKGLHQALAAGRLGGEVSFVGRVGRDQRGDSGEEWLRQAGVDVRYLSRSDSTATGVGVILLADDGIPAIVSSLGANAELNEEEVEAALAALQPARLLLTQFEIRPEVALHATRVARRYGMSVVVNPAPASHIAPGEMGDTDVLVPNESEAKSLLRIDQASAADPGWMAVQLREQTGARCVVITLGERGVAVADEEGSWATLPPEVPVADTSGAGDVFCAALAVRLAANDPMRTAAGWACAAAALSVTRPGTIPSFPTKEEVEGFTSHLHQPG
ncbi:MAG TPA: ribokinase [Chloroflexota bacterium]|nr:ribokinase [Chloroflexota bacterium]